MKETRIRCDVKCCFEEGKELSFFKERLAGNAGGMENWYYYFDLCNVHQRVLLKEIMAITEQKTLIELTKKLNVITRVTQ